jgi:hypothetical protein
MSYCSEYLQTEEEEEVTEVTAKMEVKYSPQQGSHILIASFQNVCI